VRVHDYGLLHRSKIKVNTPREGKNCLAYRNAERKKIKANAVLRKQVNIK